MTEAWAIVGGGLLGMRLAQRLAEAGHRVTLYEASPQLGGMADVWQLGDICWDRHYHVTLLSDAATRGLVAELGLAGAERFTTTRTDFYWRSAFHPMSSALDFLRFPALSLIGKVRQAATILYASRVRDGRRLEAVPIRDWLVRLSGAGVYARIWLPLLRAKLGANAETASAAFIWAIIQRLYAARRSGMKRELFGHLAGGYAQLLSAYEARLRQLGVEIVLQRAVGAVTAGPAVDGRAFHGVVVTAASPVALRLVRSLGAAESAAHAALTYQGIVCVSLLLRQPLRGAYLTYLVDGDLPFTAIVEMSALTGTAPFGGAHLVYLPAYVPAGDPLMTAPDDTIAARFLAALLQLYPHLRESDVLACRISRVPHVLSVPTLDYSARLPPVATGVPGVFILNGAHITSGTLNVNETLRLADAQLPAMLAHRWPGSTKAAA